MYDSYTVIIVHAHHSRVKMYHILKDIRVGLYHKFGLSEGVAVSVNVIGHDLVLCLAEAAQCTLHIAHCPCTIHYTMSSPIQTGKVSRLAGSAGEHVTKMPHTRASVIESPLFSFWCNCNSFGLTYYGFTCQSLLLGYVSLAHYTRETNGSRYRLFEDGFPRE